MKPAENRVHFIHANGKKGRCAICSQKKSTIVNEVCHDCTTEIVRDRAKKRK